MKCLFVQLTYIHHLIHTVFIMYLYLYEYLLYIYTTFLHCSIDNFRNARPLAILACEQWPAHHLERPRPSQVMFGDTISIGHQVLTMLGHAQARFPMFTSGFSLLVV